MGAGFVPPILDRAVLDGTLRIPSVEALTMARRLAREEGLLVGISGGANICAAIEVSKK
jgi:cysteine synthase